MSRTNNPTLSAVPPCFTGLLHLCPQQDTNISPANHVCLQRRSILRLAKAVFPAPSAVHLTSRVSPGSQPPKLSVKASLPLSPLQRFEVLNAQSIPHPSPAVNRLSRAAANIFHQKITPRPPPFLGIRTGRFCLAEFRQDAGIKCNLFFPAAQGELPEGQERVAWAMYVGKNTAQTGKCRSVKQMCRWHICSVGPTCYRWGNLPAKRVHAPGCNLTQMLAFG